MANTTGKKFAGRQKGTPNKVTADVKAMILGALEKAGGETYLFEQSKENPVAFMTLVGKVLPMTVVGDKDNPLNMVHKIEVELVSPKTASR